MKDLTMKDLQGWIKMFETLQDCNTARRDEGDYTGEQCERYNARIDREITPYVREIIVRAAHAYARQRGL